MASLTLTVPDAQVSRIVTAVAAYRGVDVSSMTLAQKAAMLKADIRDYWIDLMRNAEVPAVASAAATTATATRVADIAANVTLT